MKNLINGFLILLTTGLIPLSSFAQKTFFSPNLQKNIYDVLLKHDKSHHVLKDSVALYTFDIKLSITKAKNGKTIVSKLEVSDSLVYKMFPNYKNLSLIDFTSILGDRRQVNLVIPILIGNLTPSGSSKFERQNGTALLDVESALHVLEKSFSSIAESKMNKFGYVFAMPQIIVIYNIKKKLNNKYE